MSENDAPLDEFALIARWLSHFTPTGSDVVVPAGDDAAVLRPTAGQLLVATTDALVEGVHFRRETWPPGALGHKALAVNLSDLAAMGARPRHALVALALPADVDTGWLDKVAAGMARCARDAEVALVGGNVSAASEVSLTVTLLGEARPDRILRRSGAKAGDLVFVSGTLGDAAAGLSTLTRKPARTRRLTDLERRHCRPAPRVALGRALAEGGLATAAIDVSDGFVADLRHLLEASGVGAEIRTADLPLSPAYRRAGLGRRDPMRLALTGGEDYELVFTASEKRAAAIAAAGKKTATPVRAVGRITSDTGLRLLDANGGEMKVESPGWLHR